MTTTTELTAKNATSTNFMNLSGAERVFFLQKIYSTIEGKKIFKMDFINEFFKSEIEASKEGFVIQLHKFTNINNGYVGIWDLYKNGATTEVRHRNA